MSNLRFAKIVFLAEKNLDVGGEENLAEGVPRAIRPIVTVEGSSLHGHGMDRELIEAGQACLLQLRGYLWSDWRAPSAQEREISSQPSSRSISPIQWCPYSLPPTSQGDHSRECSHSAQPLNLIFAQPPTARGLGAGRGMGISKYGPPLRKPGQMIDVLFDNLHLSQEGHRCSNGSGMHPMGDHHRQVKPMWGFRVLDESFCEEHSDLIEEVSGANVALPPCDPEDYISPEAIDPKTEISSPEPLLSFKDLVPSG
eukprot:maker-scaffold400_size182785-snap-gene-0.24 protein:Tk02294 transcript:maker-scaffold400_size182785-snap-gene-0.24-mRNA-1 annotation:"endonuclease exonuclease phosphatase family protein"